MSGEEEMEFELPKELYIHFERLALIQRKSVEEVVNEALSSILQDFIAEEEAKRATNILRSSAVSGNNIPTFLVGDYARNVLARKDQITYAFNTAGPNQYDCSGLTMAAWAAAGITLPHNSQQQYDDAVTVDLTTFNGHPETGDLVFYYPDLSHVGLFAGWWWDGHPKVIQATDVERGIEMINIDQYVKHVAIRRPKYTGWRH